MDTAARKVVLLVETEDEYRLEAVGALERAGFRVIACANSLDALDVLDGPEPVDMLLSRVQMPENNPHGFALARMARLKRPDLRTTIHYARSQTDLPDFELQAADGIVHPRPARGACLAVLVTQHAGVKP
jgi:CheY-like chemotaxis protein